MLTENDVVKRLTDHLILDGYRIIQSLGTLERGVDIIAENDSHTMFIEAKGETSSKSYTNRFGKPFTKNQIKSHISKAILASMRILCSEPEGDRTLAAIALPETKDHRGIIGEIFESFKKLGIIIYWVSDDKINCDNPPPNN